MSDDWDSAPSSGFGGQSNGVSSGSSGSMGAGRGRGRGRGLGAFGAKTAQVGGGGSATTNGFGSSGGGGFGSGRSFGQQNGGGSHDNDGWGDNNNSGGGFGSNRTKGGDSGGGFGSNRSGGFGSDRSSGGFGSDRSGGFGSSSGGGFGSNRRGDGDSGGGRGCFNCGSEDHQKRDCPEAGSGERAGGFRRGGGGGGRGCFNCGSEEHQKRDCPQGGGGGGSGRGCFNCGSEDHQKRDCPQGGGDAGGGGGRGCFNCGSEEHQRRDCPEASSGGGGGGGRGCFNCGSEEHQRRDCPEASTGGGGGSGECFKCHETGHFARECPNAEAVGEDGEVKPAASTYIPPEPSQDEAVIFASMQKGINFDKYDDIPVEVSGNNPPRSINSFDEAELYDKIRENVRKAKYDKPTPVQKYGIPIVSGGRDLMACAQTGSGKTAAFLLPILTGMLNRGLESSALSVEQTPQTVIVSPTRELAIQIYEESRKFSFHTMLKCVVIYGGTKVMHQISQVERGCNLLVATPGRLMDFINRGRINLSKVQYLVLDEADRMLDMGFGPEMERLVNNPNMPKKGERQTLMFSATFPNEVQERAAEYLNDYLFLTVGRVGGANSDVKQVVVQVDQTAKKDKLLEILQAQPENDRTLVFTETKRGADFLASYLSQSGFPTTSIHGDREQREREEALADFKSNRASVLVATSVASRGLDIPAVKHVVNFDLPSEIDDYVHRIGRTGRCGNTGLSTSFYNGEKDAGISRALIKILADAQQEVPEFLEAVADSAIGTFHGNAGGRFGGRDTRSGPRRGGFAGGSGGGGQEDSWNSGGGGGGGGGGGAVAGGNDEEEWD